MGQAVQKEFFLDRRVTRQRRQLIHNLRGGSLKSRKHNTTFLTTEHTFLAIRSCQAQSLFSCLGFLTRSTIMKPVVFRRIFVNFLQSTYIQQLENLGNATMLIRK